MIVSVPRRRRASAAAGSSLVEVLIGASFVAVAVLALVRTAAQGLQLERSNRETSIALHAAREGLETLRDADPAQAFALFNSNAADDPAGAGSAPGNTFPVTRLPALPGAATALGRYVFPCATSAPDVLDETATSPFHDAAADLDLDGAATTRNVNTTYRILPVAIQVSWQGANGPRTVEIATVLRR